MGPDPKQLPERVLKAYINRETKKMKLRTRLKANNLKINRFILLQFT